MGVFMKKKILFVNKSFELGGIQSSLNNLINVLSKDDGLEIDLFIYNPEGMFKESVPPNVNIISPSLFVRTMGMTFKQAIKSKKLIVILFKFFSTIWSKLFGNSFPIWVAFLFQKNLLGYDYAFAYHHEVGKKTMVSGFSRFVLSKTDARYRASWIHTDVKETGLDTKAHRFFYNKLDGIVAVSHGVKNHFIDSFPEFKDKTYVVHNFHQVDMILELSQREPVQYDKEVINILTVARISEEKGQMRMIDVFDKLKKDGCKFCWHVVGGAPEETMTLFRQKIEEKHLGNNIVIYGQQKNPYRFFVNADILLVPSHNEAAPMVFSEATYLKLPIVTTRTSSAEEFVGGDIGIICENNDKKIYEALKYILTDRNIIKTFKKTLSTNINTIDFKCEFWELLMEQKDDK